MEFKTIERMNKNRINFLLNAIPKHKDSNVRDVNMCDRVACTCDMLDEYNPTACDGTHLKQWHDRLMLEQTKGIEGIFYNVNNIIYCYDNKTKWRIVCRNFEKQKDKFKEDFENGCKMEFLEF